MADFSWNTKAERGKLVAHNMPIPEGADLLVSTLKTEKSDSDSVKQIVTDMMDLLNNPCTFICYELQSSLDMPCDKFRLGPGDCEENDCPGLWFCNPGKEPMIKRGIFNALRSLHFLLFGTHYRDEEDRDLRCSERCMNYEACKESMGVDRVKLCAEELKRWTDMALYECTEGSFIDKSVG